jgi:hypothetical protein
MGQEHELNLEVDEKYDVANVEHVNEPVLETKYACE